MMVRKCIWGDPDGSGIILTNSEDYNSEMKAVSKWGWWNLYRLESQD